MCRENQESQGYCGLKDEKRLSLEFESRSYMALAVTTCCCKQIIAGLKPVTFLLKAACCYHPGISSYEPVTIASAII